MQIIRRKDCYGLLCFVQFQLSISQGLRWCIKLGPLEVQFSKWFYSVKKGVLNLFLSMAYNVISCEKAAGKFEIAKFAISIWLPTSEVTKKKAQNDSLNCDVLKF